MKRSPAENADDRHLFEMLPSGKRQHDPGKALSKLDGVYFTGGHKGVMTLGETDAELVLEPDGSIRIRAAAPLLTAPALNTLPLNTLPLNTPPLNTPPLTRAGSPRLQPLEMLRITHGLPGNLRYVRDGAGGALVADTQIDGITHLPHTFRSLRDAILRSLHVPAADAAISAAAIERQVVEQALTKLPWAEDGVVEQEDGWELRPRLRGDPVPVRMTVEADGLRLSRIVLYELPAPGTAGAMAIAEYALRLNGSLRHARLAISDDRLAAEARLDSQLVHPDWLAMTACAVAAAARHAATPLRLLAGQRAVAERYIRMFCSNGEQPAPAGAGG
jgi:hypothetical protein